MSSHLSFGKIEFNFSTAAAEARSRRDSEAPFRVALLGDFSGRTSRNILEPIGAGRAHPVDVDNFGAVLARLQARLRLPPQWQPAEPFEVRLASLEDFHPDRIVAGVPALRGLVDKRGELLNPATAAGAAAALTVMLGLRSESIGGGQAASGPVDAPAAAESHEDTLARLLGGSRPAAAPSPPTPARPGPDIGRLIRQIVAPVTVPAASPEQTAVLSALDLELTHQLRAILHHPAWQSLEAAWRGADLWVRQFGADENVQLSLIDVSADELASDLHAAPDLAATGLCKLMRGLATDTPWALLLGHYTFRPTSRDLQTLGRTAKIAALLGAPFVAGAGPEFVGCDSFGAHPDPDDWTRPLGTEAGESWQALRSLPEASSLGLVLPRFLARLPYGRSSDPIDAFPFEEWAEGTAHDSYLWGNPAILLGCVLADAFQAEGWEMQAVGSGEVGEMPVHKFSEQGETKVKPCAEAWLSERGGDAILARGLMPLLSIRGRDAVRLAQLQSVAQPPAPLCGRWG